jgi:hypothetical protein
MLTELLRPAGAELARRWVAALLLVPADEREDVVNAVEQQIVKSYLPGDALGIKPKAARISPRQVHVVSPAVQRDGYHEHIERTFEIVDEQPELKKKTKPKRRAR